jgi:threonine/homoserine/homoserine lactone efflux protein
MIKFLSTGAILGLSAGFAPGPLLALVISETLQYDMIAGFKVAVAPILTDLPIIVLTLLLLAKLSSFHTILGVISVMGALFILYMGYESIRTTGASIGLDGFSPNSLRKGIVVNALNPHPYLFWLTVGAPITIKAMDHGFAETFAFIGSFYVMLVGSKIVLALLVGKSRSFLTDNMYIYTMRCLGLVLIGFAVFLLIDGLKLAGLL